MLKTEFLFNNIVLESVKEFKYLGIVFPRSGSFCKVKKKNISVNRHKKPCTELLEK